MGAYLRRSFVFLCLVLLPALGALPLRAQSWAAAPLRTPTPIPDDGLPRERLAFWAWLTDSAATLSPERIQSTRERLYVYISQFAKSTGGAFPLAGDSEATRLFAVAAWMNVPGSDQMLHVLAPERAPSSPIPVPQGVTLHLQASDFTLASDDSSWAVCFPYYFMPAPMGRQVLANGVPTELAVLSTLFAPDSGPPGSSQATILIAAGPVADSAAHVALWLEQLGVVAAPSTGSAALGEWFSASDQGVMRREALIHRLPGRVIVIGYVGLRGTFEANRPQFLDVVRTLGTSKCAG